MLVECSVKFKLRDLYTIFTMFTWKAAILSESRFSRLSLAEGESGRGSSGVASERREALADSGP